MKRLDKDLEERLINLSKALVNQEKAYTIVKPKADSKGFWFGGGNIVKLPKERTILLCGRYRNAGDSRFGVAAGERGLELAIFESSDGAKTFSKIHLWNKSDLSYNGIEVVSIEGSCLHLNKNGNKIEMFVSTEKKLEYPESVRQYQKPGTGIWSIDVFESNSIEDLNPTNIRNVLSSQEPSSLHIKDPVVYDAVDENTYMIYCQHPFSWTSGYSGCAVRKKGKDGFQIISNYLLLRGHTWDVAVTRITGRLAVPKIGKFAKLPPISLYFYDGAECMKEHKQSEIGVKRARGYSCEEIGGLAYGFDNEFPVLHRLSRYFPLFVSPNGTGCSRYVSVFYDGIDMIATWQKSMPDLSQPLVCNKLSKEEIKEILE